jgi:hypothetical protein
LATFQPSGRPRTSASSAAGVRVRTATASSIAKRRRARSDSTGTSRLCGAVRPAVTSPWRERTTDRSGTSSMRSRCSPVGAP